MSRLRNFWNSFFLHPAFFIALGLIAILFTIGHFYELYFTVGTYTLVALIVLLFTDILILYGNSGITGRRTLNSILSNGDLNDCSIHIDNHYAFPVSTRIFEEIPEQLGLRELKFRTRISARSAKDLDYRFKPTSRGEYSFGNIVVLARSPLQLVSRRYDVEASSVVPVYPSYVYLNQYNLSNFKQFTSMIGIQKRRRIGHSSEFEQIREYVKGDDIRHVNWKSSAKHGDLMVNQYTEEKSKEIYCVIDTGRAMQMPFEGLSLLDYAINASLAMSHVIIKNHDRAGLIYFNRRVEKLMKPDKSIGQIPRILSLLYNLQTDFKESSFEQLFAQARFKINHRSLLILFTNFEDMNSLERQLPYLAALASMHVLLVVFFRNSEVEGLTLKRLESDKSFYEKSVAEKLSYQKELMVKELNRHGIQTLLTRPEDLTMNTINKYLEIKARGVL